MVTYPYDMTFDSAARPVAGVVELPCGVVDVGGPRHGFFRIQGLVLAARDVRQNPVMERVELEHWMTPGELYTLTVEEHGQVVVTGARWMRRVTRYVLEDDAGQPPTELPTARDQDVALIPGVYRLDPTPIDVDWMIFHLVGAAS